MSNDYSLNDDRIFMELNNKIDILSIELVNVKYELGRKFDFIIHNHSEEIHTLDNIFTNLNDDVYELF